MKQPTIGIIQYPAEGTVEERKLVIKEVLAALSKRVGEIRIEPEADYIWQMLSGVMENLTEKDLMLMQAISIIEQLRSMIKEGGDA